MNEVLASLVERELLFLGRKFIRLLRRVECWQVARSLEAELTLELIAYERKAAAWCVKRGYSLKLSVPGALHRDRDIPPQPAQVAKGALRILEERPRGLMPYHLDRSFLTWLDRQDEDLLSEDLEDLFGDWIEHEEYVKLSPYR